MLNINDTNGAGLWNGPWSELRRGSLGLPAMTPRDALMAVVGCSLLLHQIVRRYEPKTPNQMLVVIFSPPVVLTLLLLNSNLFSSTNSINPQSLVLSFILTFSAYITTLLFSMVVYRLSPWHPLAHYPGPLFLRVSKLGIVWRTRNDAMFKYIYGLHAKYGDYVRVGPNEISIRNVDAVLPILGANGLPRGVMWDGRSAAALHPEQRSLVGLREWHDHAERRKLWNKGFSSVALKDYEQIVIRRGRQLIEALETRKEKVDIAMWLGYFTFDFMGDMVFGGGFELLRDGKDKEGVWTLIKEAVVTVHQMGQLPWAAILLKRFGPKSQADLKLRTFASAWGNKRLSEGSFARDLWHYLYEGDNVLSKHSIARMPSEGVTAIVAGSDTTMTVLSNIWYFMCTYPEYMARLQAEVEKTFPGLEEPLDVSRLSHMSFLNAVINEALRLQPPVPSGAQRCVPSGEGEKIIASQHFPEGTQVSIHTYALHHDPRCFSPHPDEFWPDRWLVDSEREFPAHLFGPKPSVSAINAASILNHIAFIPFSFGPANCVGKNVAILEIRMITALIAQKFNTRFAKGYDAGTWLAEQKDYFVMKVGQLEVELAPRF